MVNPEVLLRRILGPVRSSLRPLALAVEIADNLLFFQHFSMDDIKVTKYIYPEVAALICCKPKTASRRIERLTHLCWNSLEQQNLVVFYLGRDLKLPPTPGSLIIYLAVYAHLDLPFFTVIEQNPHFLFQSPDDKGTSSALDKSILDSALLHNKPLQVSQVMTFKSFSGPLYFPVCPNCGVTLEREYQNFCDRCGQRLNWQHFN